MLTIFSTAKPFKGHFATIQRNAIKSWTLLHPDCEVILFGDEEGTAEVAQEFGIRHEPQLQRNEHGTPFLNFMFDRAQEIARHGLLCYVNCDILLMSDFRDALERVSHWQRTFLMIGRRWNTNIAEPWDFTDPDWERRLRALALQEGKRGEPGWIDYFVFSRGLYYTMIPPFLIGRPGWDHWLVWKTRSLGHPVVDVSSVVTAVHQNHDYSHIAHLAASVEKIWESNESTSNHKLAGSEEATWNLKLAGTWGHLYSTENATHRLNGNGIHNMPPDLALRRAPHAEARVALRILDPERYPTATESLPWLAWQTARSIWTYRDFGVKTRIAHTLWLILMLLSPVRLAKVWAEWIEDPQSRPHLLRRIFGKTS